MCQKRKRQEILNTKYILVWEKKYPVQSVKNDRYKFRCLPCDKALSCGYQGLKDVSDHCERDSHKTNYVGWKKQATINFFGPNPDFKSKVLNAEVIVTNFLIQHNLPLATADHLGPLFRTIFPDSKIASSYACARTKTFTILNEAFAPHCHDYIVEHCKSHPYSVGHDGSNDTGIQKMSPVCIRLFDIKRSKTVTEHFFDMCLTEGEDCGKAYKIFEAIEKSFEKSNMLWTNCVSLSVDNTNSMVGCHNSVASRFLKKIPNVLSLDVHAIWPTLQPAQLMMPLAVASVLT